ncbi:MAG: MarR family transcriptional regulator, transcriptional regulator for hemolysin [Verrucomicrobiota bacterium]|jgi:MarR family transcriptional regulator for hemolysin
MPASTPNEFGQVLFGTARAWRTKLDQRLRPLGLSQGKWRTLIHLSEGGNKLTQKEIAERMGIEGPTLAGLLDRLQEDGWVERRGSQNDRRCKIVHLQRRSKAVLEKIFNTAHELRHELIDNVPQDDLQTCIRVLDEIRAKAEQSANGGQKARRSLAKKHSLS